jgi:hypothetical protein
METIVVHAQGLVYSLLCLVPSLYQKDSFKALMGLFPGMATIRVISYHEGQ